MKINRNSWHYRMIAKDRQIPLDKDGTLWFEWDVDKLPKDNCAYFWAFMLGITSRAVFASLIFLFATLFLNALIGDWVYGWYTLFTMGEVQKLWDGGSTSGFWLVNALLVALPAIIGVMWGYTTAGPVISTKIEDLKEGRCSLIEYTTEGEKK